MRIAYWLLAFAAIAASGCGRESDRPAQSVPVRASASTDWPMFRGSPALWGIAEATLPNSLSSLWTFKTQGPVKSSAAIVDGKVIIGSGDGNVYCLDLSSGSQVLAFKT